MKDRLRELMHHLNETNDIFCKRMKVSRGTLVNYTKGHTKPNIQKIVNLYNSYKKLNLTWLITGEGTMTVSDNKEVYKLKNELLDCMRERDKYRKEYDNLRNRI